MNKLIIALFDHKTKWRIPLETFEEGETLGQIVVYGEADDVAYYKVFGDTTYGLFNAIKQKEVIVNGNKVFLEDSDEA